MGIQAHRGEGADIDAANLDIFDSASPQSTQWGLPGAVYALGPNRTVKLVLNLQQAVVQLLLVAILTAAVDSVIRVRLQNGLPQSVDVIVQ